MIAGSSEPTGALFVVSTPIGNMADISRRAVDLLGIVDAIACEDTRRTGKLLSLLGIEAPKLIRVDAHTETDETAAIIDRLESGERVALVSDAGTPAVSDPGSRLVASCTDAGVRVVAVPGASAALAALVSSGLPTERFAVDGFLPRKGADRQRALSEIASRSMTSIIYESPNRTAATLRDLMSVCGSDRPATVARELTKLHEEVVRATLAELATQFSEDVKGEVVIVVGPAPLAEEATDDDILASLMEGARSGMSRRSAVDAAVAATCAKKRRIYELALTMSWPDGDGSAA